MVASQWEHTSWYKASPFSLCSQSGRSKWSLWVLFSETLILRAYPLWLQHVLKGCIPIPSYLENRISKYEFWGHTNIHPIASRNSGEGKERVLVIGIRVTIKVLIAQNLLILLKTDSPINSKSRRDRRSLVSAPIGHSSGCLVSLMRKARRPQYSVESSPLTTHIFDADSNVYIILNE